jgi:hypothetical protein
MEWVPTPRRWNGMRRMVGATRRVAPTRRQWSRPRGTAKSPYMVGTALAGSWIVASQDIRQRNRRVGIILAGVFIALLVGSVIFIVIRHWG